MFAGEQKASAKGKCVFTEELRWPNRTL